MKTFSRYFLLLFFLNINSIFSFSQEQPKIFFRIIDRDSSVMYFSESHYFTGKQCAVYFRYTRIDSAGNFHGYFKDYNARDVLIASGHYIHGVKNGYFRFYYPNGSPQSKGSYRDGKPLGRWDYFYENGQLERVLMLTPTDITVVQQYDIDQKPIVTNGNGTFKGYVAGVNSNSNNIFAIGKLINGKPDGKWISKLMEASNYCTEEYDNGRFLKGSFPNVLPGGKKNYTDKPFLNTFFLYNYLDDLEKFRFMFCKDTVKKEMVQKEVMNYMFNWNNFSSELLNELNRIIAADIKSNTIENYTFRENYLTISFKVDSKGKPTDCKLVSSFGSQLFYAIERVIETTTKFPPSSGTLYFHLQLEFNDNYSYRSHFYFSKNSSMSKQVF